MTGARQEPTAAAEDAALLARYAAGEPGVARLLVARLGPMAYRLARRMLGDTGEAEEVAQEAMLRLWRVAPDWQSDGAKVSTWLYRVTANLATDQLRRRRPQAPDAALQAIADGAASAAQSLIAAERLAALDAALLTLPERQRQAVILRHLENLSNGEIAEIMGLGIEAVESLTARGKRALSATLAGRRTELGFDDD